MIIIGLTGSIGMGKTTVAKMFASLGIPVLDSDLVVHEIMTRPGIIKRISALFPAALKKGALDRTEIGKAVFGKPKELRKLESILHPKVKEAQRKFIQKQRLRGAKAVVLDIPLLYETHGERRMDHVVVVSAPITVQKQRVMKRPNMTEAKLRSILKRQLSDEKKRKKADFLVRTGEGKGRSLRDVRMILQKIKP